MVTVPRDAAFSNGVTEREIDLVKIAFAKAREMYPDETDWAVLKRVAMAKNMSPNLNTGLSPATSMVGRSDLPGPLECTPQILETSETDVQGNKLFAAQEISEKCST